MATEKLNFGNNRSQVAYDMAKNIWYQRDKSYHPGSENTKEFLDLVQECVRALEPGHRALEGEVPIYKSSSQTL